MTEQASLSSSGSVFDILYCGVEWILNVGIEVYEMIMAPVDVREEAVRRYRGRIRRE